MFGDECTNTYAHNTEMVLIIADMYPRAVEVIFCLWSPFKARNARIDTEKPGNNVSTCIPEVTAMAIESMQ